MKKNTENQALRRMLARQKNVSALRAVWLSFRDFCAAVWDLVTGAE